MTTYRYKAFISYSHQDRKWAAWLQRALEGYRVPRRLVGSRGAFGPIPRRLAPVFRDREDLSSGSDLSAKVKESLEASESLIVICSPTAARSDWVSEEIRYFQQLGRADRVFAVIVDGDPQAAEPAQQCFAPALTLDAEGAHREPLAADARKWADGRLLAKLKIIAGVLGIHLDDLRRRDMQRRQRVWLSSMGGALAIAVTMSVLAVMAITARQAAENRREHAEDLVGYMVGDLRNKLDEVGRLDILEGMSDRVGDYLQTLNPEEVTDASLSQQARVWRQLGEVGMDQADWADALESFTTSRDILLELHRRNPEEAQFVYELGNAEFWVGYVHLEIGAFDEAERALNDYLGWAYRLNEIEPGNPAWLIEQSYAHSNLAALINQRGGSDVERALLHIRKAVDLNRQVIELAPDDLTYLSEYSGVLAWLADTQLLSCDLGGALISRQEGAAIARQLTERAPGNSNYKSRYAFSLTGLYNVSLQVGLVEPAIEHVSAARDILRELSRADPSNLDLRFEFLSREFYLADALAEAGRLPEAIARMDEIRPAIREVLESESYSNVRRYATWVNFLLARSDMAWRSGEPATATAALGEALSHLERMLEVDDTGAPFKRALTRARFLAWHQQGRDLFANAPFAVLDVEYGDDGACMARADAVRQAILTGDEETAGRLASSLLSKGFFEPSFIRVCSGYGVCEGDDLASSAGEIPTIRTNNEGDSK